MLTKLNNKKSGEIDMFLNNSLHSFSEIFDLHDNVIFHK